MDLALSETQQQLMDSVSTFLTRLPAQVMPQEPSTAPEAVWTELGEELGLLSLMLDEDAGGFGGRGEDLLVVCEAMGKSLFNQPFIESAVTAISLLKASSNEQAVHLLEAIAAGQAQAGVVLDAALVAASHEGRVTLTGDCGLVYPSLGASHLILCIRSTDQTPAHVFLVPTSAATLKPVATLDARWAAHVTLNHAEALLLWEGAVAQNAIDNAEDLALAALCAEASGVLGALLDQTVEFTKQRRQFGQPISRFQVLQHRMSDMLMHYEMARSAAILACLSLDKEPLARRKATSAAKIVVCEAARFIGQNAVQLHGGLGMSEETEMTRWFKRATVLEYQLGSRDQHIERYRTAA